MTTIYVVVAGLATLFMFLGCIIPAIICTVAAVFIAMKRETQLVWRWYRGRSRPMTV